MKRKKKCTKVEEQLENTYQTTLFLDAVSSVEQEDEFEKVEKEKWILGDKYIFSKYGTMKVLEASFYDEQEFTGIEFRVVGHLSNFFGRKECREVCFIRVLKAINEKTIYVTLLGRDNSDIVSFQCHDMNFGYCILKKHLEEMPYLG